MLSRSMKCGIIIILQTFKKWSFGEVASKVARLELKSISVHLQNIQLQYTSSINSDVSDWV